MKNTKKSLKYIAFDIETTGFLKYEGDEIFAYCMTDWDGHTIVNRLDHDDEKLNKKNWDFLQDFFNDTSIVKIAHNAYFELTFCRAVGLHVPEDTIWHDTMIMHQILNTPYIGKC